MGLGLYQTLQLIFGISSVSFKLKDFQLFR